MKAIQLSAQLAETGQAGRLDQALSATFPDFSRSRLQKWVKEGYVLVDGECIKDVRYKVRGGEHVTIEAELQAETDWQPEPMELDIIYEDDDILVINKPADMVVHPAAGNYQGTLVNGLLHLRPALEAIPRAGVVHRLDKDTTGLMVVAKSLSAHHSLVDQLKRHEVGRHYRCLVYGAMVAGGTVDKPVGRNPANRKQMAVNASGKPAVTHYRLVQRFRDFTLLNISLETGRTHQIRVHMASLRHPLVGDPVYGGRLRLPKGCGEALTEALQQFRRQALHAWQLTLTHPISGDTMQWQAPMPEDFLALLQILEQDSSQND